MFRDMFRDLFRSLRRLNHGLKMAFSSSRVNGLMALTGTLILIASIFYSYVEGWRLLDLVYFSVITLATVGYGDFSPKTDAGKIFTIIYVFCGLGVFVATATSIADVILKDQGDDEDDKS